MSKNNIESLLAFIKKNERMPKIGIKEEHNLYQWFLKNKEECLNNPVIKKTHKKTKRQSYNIKTLINFVEKKQRMPKARIKKENGLYWWFFRNKVACLENPIIKSTYNRKRDSKYNIKTLLRFIQENKRMPKGNVKKEGGLYQWFLKNKEECLNNPVIKKTTENASVKILEKRKKESLESLIQFIKENNRMPRGDVKAEWALYKQFRRNKEDFLKNNIVKKTYKE